MTYLNIIQIIASILLIIAVLLQQRGSGLSSAFGGNGSVYSTRRGIEKFIFRATILLAIVFLATAFAQLLVK